MYIYENGERGEGMRRTESGLRVDERAAAYKGRRVDRTRVAGRRRRLLQGHPRDYSDFKGLVFGICRRHKRTASLNWMSFGFIDFTITAAVRPSRALRRRRSFPLVSLACSPSISLSSHARHVRSVVGGGGR